MDRSQLHRLYFIHQAVVEGTLPTCRRLAEKLEVNPRTINRDLDFLRDDWGAPLEFDRPKGGWCYAKPYLRLQPAGPTPRHRPFGQTAKGPVREPFLGRGEPASWDLFFVGAAARRLGQGGQSSNSLRTAISRCRRVEMAFCQHRQRSLDGPGLPIITGIEGWSGIIPIPMPRILSRREPSAPRAESP